MLDKLKNLIKNHKLSFALILMVSFYLCVQLYISVIVPKQKEKSLQDYTINYYFENVDDNYTKIVKGDFSQHSKEYYIFNAYESLKDLNQYTDRMSDKQKRNFEDNKDRYDVIIELHKDLYKEPFEGLPVKDIGKTDLGEPSGVRIEINDLSKKGDYWVVKYKFTYYWSDSVGRDIFRAHVTYERKSKNHFRDYDTIPKYDAKVTQIERKTDIVNKNKTILAPYEDMDYSLINETLIGIPDRTEITHDDNKTKITCKWILDKNTYFAAYIKDDRVYSIIDNRKRYNIPIAKDTDHSVESSGQHGERDNTSYYPRVGLVPTDKMRSKWKYLGNDSKTGYDKYVYYADIYGYIITADPSDNKILSVEQKKQFEINENEIIKKEIKSLTIRDLKVGDATVFGKYDIKGSGTAEELRWLVIAVEDDRLLLLSEHAVASGPYKYASAYLIEPGVKGHASATWKTSDAREWLDDVFYTEAFSKSEKKRIKKIKVEPQDQSYAGVTQGKTTEDRIFLLSAEDVEKYVQIDYRKCTEYVKSYGAYKEQLCNWWTRSSGDNQDTASCVSKNGLLLKAGAANYLNEGLRPAMWIKRDDSDARKTKIVPTTLKENTPTASYDSSGNTYIPKKDTEKDSDDEYDIDDFTFVEDFYEWYEDDFESLEDAEEYWYAHGGD